MLNNRAGPKHQLLSDTRTTHIPSTVLARKFFCIVLFSAVLIISRESLHIPSTQLHPSLPTAVGYTHATYIRPERGGATRFEFPGKK